MQWASRARDCFRDLKTRSTLWQMLGSGKWSWRPRFLALCGRDGPAHPHIFIEEKDAFRRLYYTRLNGRRACRECFDMMESIDRHADSSNPLASLSAA